MKNSKKSKFLMQMQESGTVVWMILWTMGGLGVIMVAWLALMLLDKL
jgi:hypothetical protein